MYSRGKLGELTAWLDKLSFKLSEVQVKSKEVVDVLAPNGPRSRQRN